MNSSHGADGIHGMRSQSLVSVGKGCHAPSECRVVHAGCGNCDHSLRPDTHLMDAVCGAWCSLIAASKMMMRNARMTSLGGEACFPFCEKCRIGRIGRIGDIFLRSCYHIRHRGGIRRLGGGLCGG